MKRRWLLLVAAFAVFVAVANPTKPEPASAAPTTAGLTCVNFTKYWFALHDYTLSHVPDPTAGLFYIKLHHTICYNGNGYIMSLSTDPAYVSPTSLGFATGYRVDIAPPITYTVSQFKMYRVNMSGSVRQCVGYYTNICGGALNLYLSDLIVAPHSNGGGAVINEGIGSARGSLRVVPYGNFASNMTMSLCNGGWTTAYGCYD